MSKLSEYFGANIEFSDFEDLVRDVRALIVAESLSGREIDTLCQAIKGPMSSGDTPSKHGRGMLLTKDILCQTSSLTDEYTFSVTYPFGWKVWKALEVISSFKPQQGKGEE